MAEELEEKTRYLIAYEASNAAGVNEALDYYVPDLNPQQRNELLQTVNRAIIIAVGYTELIGANEGDVLTCIEIYNASISERFKMAKREMNGE